MFSVPGLLRVWECGSMGAGLERWIVLVSPLAEKFPAGRLRAGNWSWLGIVVAPLPAMVGVVVFLLWKLPGIVICAKFWPMVEFRMVPN